MAFGKKQAPEAPKDKLAGLSKVATRKKSEKKKDDRPEIVVSEPDLQRDLGNLIKLGVIDNDVSDLFGTHKKEVGDTLFNEWVESLWTDRKVPDNPRYIIKKKDENGRDTAFNDMAVIFQVQFRADGLQHAVPDQSDLDEGETVEDKLVEALTSDVVGLSEANAIKLVKQDEGEIQIEQRYELADSFNKMYRSNDAETKSAAEKLLDYIQAQGKKGSVTLPVFTEEERGKLIAVRQVVTLKEGFFERAFTYCRNVEELRKLLLFVKVKLVFSSFEFGISDKKKERVARLEHAVADFLSTQDGEDD